MTQPIIQVDSFTAAPFGGNPAAVCIMAGPREAGWMQNVAKEMNLSETAFLHLEDGGYRLRWFTPAVEVKLCGHATLAAAHVLWEDGHLERNETAMFYTQSGTLAAIKDGEWIRM
ncbi:MAG: PhzF family phenazine biosynthesis protein, partial [Candidatus Sericytochromatia bacterium]|nr:PhzF family phenazine biosynthesis protein [Candidatus Tanganyikabacteria bacterium]